MKQMLAIAALALFVTGCDNSAKLKEDQQKFEDTVKEQQYALDMRIEDAQARLAFDVRTQAGFDRYQTFLKCRKDPPSQDASRKVCADLQRRVTTAQERLDAKLAKEKAAW